MEETGRMRMSNRFDVASITYRTERDVFRKGEKTGEIRSSLIQGQSSRIARSRFGG